MKRDEHRMDVIKIANPETLKYILSQAKACEAQIEFEWENNIKIARENFNKLSWIRRKLAWILAPKHLAAIARAELENGLKCCLQLGVCKKFIQQMRYKSVFMLSKNDTTWLWVPELWDKYTKISIPVIEKVF